MVDNPYLVLGISPSATPEEIKKAYRKKAKEYHPDLHPDDPEASRKMNEVNEAYDMLTNPDKYAGRTSSGQPGNSQSYYGGQNYSGSAWGNSGENGYGYGRNTYQGSGGWTGSFYGFNFEDFFGNAYGGSYGTSGNPTEEAGDSAEFRTCVRNIRAGRYQEAFNLLMRLPSTARNARWYYLAAVSAHGLGDTAHAIDFLQRASQMEPNKAAYHSLLQQYRREEQSRSAYSDDGESGYSGAVMLSPLKILGRIALILLALRLLRSFFFFF